MFSDCNNQKTAPSTIASDWSDNEWKHCAMAVYYFSDNLIFSSQGKTSGCIHGRDRIADFITNKSVEQISDFV